MWLPQQVLEMKEWDEGSPPVGALPGEGGGVWPQEAVAVRTWRDPLGLALPSP